MGLLDRLHHMDEEEAEPEAPPETKARVEAILGVVQAFLDPSNSFAMTLFVIARRELAQADSDQIETVIRGVLFAADELRSLLPRELGAGEALASEG